MHLRLLRAAYRTGELFKLPSQEVLARVTASDVPSSLLLVQRMGFSPFAHVFRMARAAIGIVPDVARGAAVGASLFHNITVTNVSVMFNMKGCVNG